MKMKSSTTVSFVSLLLICLISLKSNAQQPSGSIKGVVDSIANFDNRMPREQLFLHLDRSYYAVGDTVYMKAYLLNPQLKAATLSGVVYLEFSNEQQVLVKRLSMYYIRGIISAAIVLNEDDFKDGNYTLRAYTNWMRNFGEQNIFSKTVVIGKPDVQKSWVTRSYLSKKDAGESTNFDLKLNVSNLKNEAVGLKSLKVSVRSGSNVVLKDEVETMVDGSLNINFSIPNTKSTEGLFFYAEEKSDKEAKQIIKIPLMVNRPSAMDLQFMPEGGNLVAGIGSRLAFKALNEDGTGAEVEGNIHDESGKIITSFQSGHAGMGSVDFTPEAGMKYHATLKNAKDANQKYPLPESKPLGTVLTINTQGDSLHLKLLVSPSLAGLKKPYYLVGYARGTVCLAARLSLVNGTAKVVAPKDNFPTGISRFILFDEAYQPLNERLVFINHGDGLQVDVKQNSLTYQKRDSVSLEITIKDKDGQPVQSNFSMAVTDDQQVKADSSSSANLVSRMLLESDLKGTIENPGYYLENTPSAADAADLLLLTQGWSNYDWKGVFATAKRPEFKAEADLSATGKVTNVFNKGLPDLGVLLLSTHPAFVRETLTDKNGYFNFNHLPLVDTPSFIIQAKNKRGKSFNVGIETDAFKPPVFKLNEPLHQPWYNNSDSTMLGFVRNNINKGDYFRKLNGVNMLKEVNISAAKRIKNSRNLNGPGMADIVLEEEDIKKAGLISLEEMLLAKIKAFRVKTGMVKFTREDGTLDSKSEMNYFIENKNVHFVFDGTALDDFLDVEDTSPVPNQRYSQTQGYLNSYDATDIAGIEVLLNKNLSYVNRYGAGSMEPRPKDLLAFLQFNCYVEITTRSGRGPFQKRLAGTSLFRPPLPAFPKQFYRPRYVNNSTATPDFRTTIHWEPKVVTDANGKAVVSFYAGDAASKYTVILQGVGDNGELGYKAHKISVK